MQPDLNRTRPWPSVVTDLDPGERLVVWAFRCWACGPDHWPLVQSVVCRRFGPRLRERSIGAFAGFLDAIAGNACSALYHHAPCCPCVTPDEMCVVALVAAAQGRNSDLACAAARCFVRPDGIERVVAVAEVLGDALASQGLALPNRMRGGTWSTVPRVLH